MSFNGVGFGQPWLLLLLLMLPLWWLARRGQRPAAVTFSRVATLAAGPRLGLTLSRFLFVLRNLALAAHLGNRARELEDHPHVAEVRQRGMIVALELAQDKPTRTPYPWKERRGLTIYRHALARGVLLRPVGNVVYFMPPYVVTPAEIDLMVEVAREGIERATCD